MATKRFMVEIDLEVLSFGDLHKVTGVVASLEALASENLLTIHPVQSGAPKSRKRREYLPPLQPQTLAVQSGLAALKEPATAAQIAEAVHMKEQSVRAQLHLLMKHGHAMQVGKIEVKRGKKAAILWAITGLADMIGTGDASNDA